MELLVIRELRFNEAWNGKDKDHEKYTRFKKDTPPWHKYLCNSAIKNNYKLIKI